MEDRKPAGFWLRKWKITVYRDDYAVVVTDSTKESLRCTFQISRTIGHSPNYADITIYNLNRMTEQSLIESGWRVVVEAGYENGPFGVIFDGIVFQPLRGRENGTDLYLTLHCMDGLDWLTQNYVQATYSAGTTVKDRISAMAKDARTAIPVAYVTRDLNPAILPRGRVFMGDPKDYLRDLMKSMPNLTYTITNGELYVGRIDEACNERHRFLYTPENGLIGTPTQLQDGVSFTVLLNSNIDVVMPPMEVQLRAEIQQIKLIQGDQTIPLDGEGLYKVVSVNHVGDTRGDEWYTKVIGEGMLGKLLLQATDKRSQLIR